MQPYTKPLCILSRFGCPVKFTEYIFLVLNGDTDARIFYPEIQFIIWGNICNYFYLFIIWRIFYCIADEVDDHLLQPDSIAQNIYCSYACTFYSDIRVYLHQHL